MTERFKATFTAPKKHRFTDPDNFEFLRKLLLASGFLGGEQGVGYDDIEPGVSYEGFGIEGNTFWFDDRIGCGHRIEDQLNEVAENYSRGFPTLKFRYVRVGEEAREAETLKNGEVLTRAKSQA